MTTKQHLTNLASAKAFVAKRNEEAVTAGEPIKHPHLCDIRDGANVILQCDTKAGVYSWYLVYTSPTTGKRNQKFFLGRFDHGVNPSDAHAKALDTRRDFLSKGLDPNEEQRTEAQKAADAAKLAKANKKLADKGKAPMNSFEWMGERVLDEDRKTWKGSTATEFTRAMEKHAYPAFGKKQLADISWADDILPMIERILAGRNWFTKDDETVTLRKNSRGNKLALQKVMRFVRSVFDAALEEKIIKAVPIAEGKRAKKRAKPPATKHHARSAGLTELGYLIKQLGDVQPKKVTFGMGRGNLGDLTQARDALQISLMTIQRRTTVIAMRWDNIDFDLGDHGLWFIPRSSLNEHGEEVEGTMKGRKTVQEGQIENDNLFHVVPLSRQAKQILQNIRTVQHMSKRESDFVFPNRCVSRGDDFMGNTQMSTLLEKLGWKGRLTQHGMRTVMKTEFTNAGRHGAFPPLPATGKIFDAHLAIEIQMDHTHGKEMQRITSNMPGTYYNGDMIMERSWMMQQWSDDLEEAYKAACAAPAPQIEEDKPKLAHHAWLKRIAA
jgi:hypothetical protein